MPSVLWAGALFLFLFSASPCELAAHVRPAADPDSLLSYDLQEVVVHSEQRLPRDAATVQRLFPATLEQAVPASVSGVMRYIPSSHVTTNSRGETLVYMRGAGERQTAILFDGALLNIPWDNRLDLSLLPAGIIGGMTVTKGAAAVEYGANVLGGVINLTSPSISSDGRFTDGSALYGTAGTIQANIMHVARSESFEYTTSIGMVKQDGVPLPAGADLPFNQPGGELRTNTDRRIANGFARGVYRFGETTQLGVTLIHIDAVKGVAPEGHLPADDARLWRYPDWRYTLGILSGEGRRGGALRWKVGAWIGRFGQTIDSYASLDFDLAMARQEDADFTFGTRLALAHNMGPGTVRLVGNGLVSTHHQQDVILGEDGWPPMESPVPRYIYRQQLASLGAAYDLPAVDGLLLSMSAGYEVMFMPRTGDKPAVDPFQDYSLTLGARYDYRGGFHARAAFGRKTRFPTMRELFGEALNRFLVNTALTPESALLTEVALGLERPGFTVEVIPFLNYTAGTIDQRHVTADARRLRQRVNLAGSRVAGLEVTADVHLYRSLRMSGYVTMMNVRRMQDAPHDPVRLAERPEVLGAGTLRYTGPQGVSALIEAVYTGRAYSPAPDDSLVPLDRSLVLNARVGYRIERLVWGVTGELFARADNLTNRPVVPQLGLPGPGRMLRAGVGMSF